MVERVPCSQEVRYNQNILKEVSNLSLLTRYLAVDQEKADREKSHADFQRSREISDNFTLYNEYANNIKDVQEKIKAKIAGPNNYEHEYVMKDNEKVLGWGWYMFRTNGKGTEPAIHIVILESGDLVTVKEKYLSLGKVVNKIIVEGVTFDSPEILPETTDNLTSTKEYPNGIKLSFRNMELLHGGLLTYAENLGISTFLYYHNLSRPGMPGRYKEDTDVGGILW